MSVFFYGCVTLDSYLADKRHRLDWLHQTGTAEETGYQDFYSRMDITLMGRRTFREIEGLGDPAEIYPATQNLVFTHRPLSCPGFRAVCGDPAELVRGIPREKNVWIIGGNTILAPLLEADLVDGMTIQIAPVLLGEGIPLFTQGEGCIRFRLAGVKQYGQFAELCYERAAPAAP